MEIRTPEKAMRHEDDLIIDAIEPHPNGAAWKKACDVCLFRTRNPQDFSPDEMAEVRRDCEVGLLDFYCNHRVDEDGFNRRCACYAALYL